MNKTLLFSIGLSGCGMLNLSAQNTLFSTTDDFSQFNSGAGTVSSAYYSVNNSVNGLGNSANPGGTGGVGSLELTAPGGWTSWVSGSGSPGEASNQGFMAAIDPGSVPAWSAQSSYGPGALSSYSGEMTFDLYAGNLTDWNQFGITLNYDGNYGVFFGTAASSFTGADGKTWTRYEVPYTINSVSSMTYFSVGIAENSASDVAGETIYLDNFQISTVPEPIATGLFGAGTAVILMFRRRGVR